MLATVVSTLFAILLLAALGTLGYFVYVTQRIARRAEAAVPATGKFIEIDGNRIHYVEEGEGPAIVFVHGLGGTLHHFRHPLFGGKLDGFRLIALDRPGAGWSTRAAGATGRLPEQAALVAEFIDALGLEKPLVVGHSLGGMITLTLALNHRDKISGIVLLAPLTRHREEIPPAMKPIYITSPLKRWIVAQTVAIPAALKYAPQTLDYVFGPQPTPAGYMTAGGGYLGLRPGHFYAMVTDVVAVDKDMRELEQRYEELDLPAGMIFGDADRVLDPTIHSAGALKRIKGLHFEMLPGVGHHPQYAQADKVIDMIRTVSTNAIR